ncbi:unnamed protein product [Acanthoscelides obtectus]|uniref:Uncharacterized protein n=1 Tax=Acanthoscelides obtectus TaxID=200917 RepID=A0A9P0QFK8_ACAOB|nr:unnamed protein product [Acanthoscelides obtectus]CAK1688200.1 hypothetical protein AOBTE_LOCUS36602 [Acanthoscelides obtectus]
MKLGTAKITKNCHSILYFYDVNLIITEVNDLKKKTENVAKLTRKYIEHYKHSANYLNVLYFLERKVDGKLNDIFPSTYETVPSFSVRIKRGLINGLGSIFKAITGNLDASDGEKCESLISDLQNDQNKLSEAINSQNTLSVELIDNFNKTGLFKVVIPSGKYLVKNELYFAFAGDACTETVTKQYVCKELDLRRIKESNPCEVQLLVQKTPTTCREVEAVITEPVMKKLHDFGQWILLISNETTITLSCQEGQETVKVLGSYLAEIPVGCTLELNQEPISIGSQPIIFPNIDSNTTMLPSRMTSAFI